MYLRRLARCALVCITGLHTGRAATLATISVDWDRAFHDGSGNKPLHFHARYLDDSGKVHRLEEWRMAEGHLRRRTDDRIDLHADATAHVTGQPPAYAWLILDLSKHIANRVSSNGMLRLGMLYSYYSMAHVLTRPAAGFVVVPSSTPVSHASDPSLLLPLPQVHEACSWWQIDTKGQPSTRICWATQLGVPLQTWSQMAKGWRLTFRIDELDTRPIAPATFLADTSSYQVRDLDAMQEED